MTPSFLLIVAVLGALVFTWLGWPLLRPAPAPMALPLRTSGTGLDRHWRRPLLVVALVLTLVAAGAAGWRAYGPHAAAEPQDPARAAAIARVKATIETLRVQVQAHPDDAASWEKLGLSQAALGHPADALEALRSAQRLRPDDATLLAEVALAIVVADPKEGSGEPTRLVARALAIEPANPKALALAGTLALQRKDYAEAIRHWEALARIEPPETPIGRQLQASLSEARKRADTMARAPGAIGTSTGSATSAKPSRPGAVADAARGSAAAAGPTTAGASGPAHVSGTVSLAAALRARVEPDDTVFVYARSADPARPPLAVLRKKVSDLPFAFSLDDSLAMSPDARLSSADQVVVGARISKSGQTVAHPGDLEGGLAQVAVGSADLRLEIDTIVPARP